MRGLAVLAVLMMAGCAETDPGQAGAPLEVAGWRLASGKAPTKAEFTAMVAACEGQAVGRARGKPLETCLGDLGIRRTP